MELSFGNMLHSLLTMPQINRLVVFQKNCIRSLSRNTHRFDKWMVKFLIAHALALEDKVDDLWPDSDINQTPGNAHLERSRITQSMMMDIQDVGALSSTHPEGGPKVK